MDIFLEQPWCLSLERTTTPNKVLVVTTKGQLTAARACVDLNLPAIYKQQIMDKLDITTLQKIVPRCFDKPVTMAVSEAYATKLKQRTDIVTTGSNKPNTMNHPPRSQHFKPADITFAQAVSKNITKPQQITAPQATITMNSAIATPAQPYDYKTELDQISKEVETTLKAKFNMAIANLQKSVDNLEQKFDQKLQQNMAKLQVTQVDKATQEEHNQRLEQLTKTLGTLVGQINTLLDQNNHPTPMNSFGTS